MVNPHAEIEGLFYLVLGAVVKAQLICQLMYFPVNKLEQLCF